MGGRAGVVLLALAALTGLGAPLPGTGARPAAAQDPQQPAPRDTAAVDTAGAALPDTLRSDPLAGLAADTTTPFEYVSPRWSFSLTTGFIRYGEFQSQDVLATWTEPGGDPVSRVMRRSIDADGGIQVSGSALLGLSRAWAVRAGATFGTGSLDVSVADEDDELQEEVASLTSGGAGDFSVLGAEAALRFRMASGRRLQPYVELGVAALRWSLDGRTPPGAETLGRTRVAGLGALGAVIPVWDRVVGRVQLSGQYFRTPVVPSTGQLAENDTLSVEFAQPADVNYADPRVELGRMLRLDVGVSVQLGRVTRPGRPGSAGAATSGAARRSDGP